MSTAPSDTYRVLYVEDAFDHALLVKAFFNALHDFVVVHVQDGDRALDRLEGESWDLVITDLNLPGADGFSIIRRARQLDPDVPILVTTGYTQAQYEEQALRAGADQVMIKPLTQSDFVDRVWSMVEREERFEGVEDATVALAVEGRFGDAVMGCGGALVRAVENDTRVIVMSILADPEDATPMEMKGAAISAEMLGLELRVDRTLFGDRDGQRDLVDRTVDEVRPSTLYVPAPDDRDASRRQASDIGRSAAAEVQTVLAYETATSGLDFRPTRFVDIRAQMMMKMESLAAFHSVGAPRADLRPRMAQAYARYWGRYRDFNEVEAFHELASDDI